MSGSPENLEGVRAQKSRELVQALAGGLRRFARTATTADDSIFTIIAESPFGRGTFLAGSAIGFGTLALAATHPELVDLLLHHPDADVINGARELLTILDSQPSENELRAGIVNRGAKIDLAAERQKVIKNTNGQKNTLRVRTIGIGDSNFYTNGIKNDGTHNHPDPQNQPHSFIQVGRNTITPHLQAVGVSSWDSYTFAVPGAPSGDGYPKDKRKYGLMGTEQFYNKDFLDLLEGQEGDEDIVNVVTISATGDDWRLLIKNALTFAHFFSELQHIEHATQADVDKFKDLLAQSAVIAQNYGDHVQECLTKIADINKRRREKGLLDIKVVIAHPFSMLGTDHIPFRTLAGDDDTIRDMGDILVKVNPNDPHDDRHYIDLTKINYGQQIAYLLTVAMYQQLSKRMQFIKDTTDLEMIPLEWMGLERISDFFFIDGHPGADGTPMQAALFLNLFTAHSDKLTDTATLDAIAAISPQISRVVAQVTKAPAA